MDAAAQRDPFGRRRAANPRRHFLVMVVLAAVALPSAACDQRPPAAPVPGTRSSTSAPDPVAAAVAADFNAHTTDDQIRAIIVTTSGRTRFERYYGSSAEEYRSAFSVTKSVVSTLVGLAISEGELRLDDRLSKMLPRYAAEMSPRVAAVTLRQLLTMTAGFTDTSSGFGSSELLNSPDWVRFIIRHQDDAPGKLFAYSDYGAHLLSPILEQATGQPVLSYARSHLFDPLGIPTRPAAQPLIDDAHLGQYERAGFAWPVDPQGHALGAAHLKIRPQDMTRLGQLFLQGGQWQGRQVVPAAWVRQATSAQAGAAFQPSTDGRFAPTNYGYLWWVTTVDGTPSYFAWGLGGQLVQVVPDRNLVMVVSSYVDLRTGEPVLGQDDLERLAHAVVHAANP
ncbi:serine hydrolase domain-containing protein [Pedococcus sp. 5OH_020]|uniref:serine hydrolase domain-containing protein n=1 Tax=Pedococcus sp. 5OH_020 TaxID=2989814 RepID=UPI0022EA0DEF|nr:serine hydrolase [Pedococcus sp. 5OH_020]